MHSQSNQQLNSLHTSLAFLGNVCVTTDEVDFLGNVCVTTDEVDFFACWILHLSPIYCRKTARIFHVLL